MNEVFEAWDFLESFCAHEREREREERASGLESSMLEYAFCRCQFVPVFANLKKLAGGLVFLGVRQNVSERRPRRRGTT